MFISFPLPIESDLSARRVDPFAGGLERSNRIVVHGSACTGTRLQRDIARPGRSLQSLTVWVPPTPRPPVNSTTMTARTGPTKILVVDDDVRLRDLLTRYLGEQGFQVAHSPTRATSTASCSAIRRTSSCSTSCCPGEDGLSVCRRLRGAARSVPIIMLTAKGEDVDRIVGLEMGADDYLGKPFNPRELVARIHAVLRRHGERLVPGAPAEEGTHRVRPPHARPRRAHAVVRRQERRADHRRVLAAARLRAAPAATARAREAHDARARTRPRSVRPRDRRPGVAAAQARRARPRQSPLHPDRLGFRLRVRARHARRSACGSCAPPATPRDAAAALAVRAPHAAAGCRRRARGAHEHRCCSGSSARASSTGSCRRPSSCSCRRSAPRSPAPTIPSAARRSRSSPASTASRIYPESERARPRPAARRAVHAGTRRAAARAAGSRRRTSASRRAFRCCFVRVVAADTPYWIGVPVPPRSPADEMPTRALVWTLVVLALLLVAAFAFARYLARPLRELTAAVERVGRGEAPPPLPESGPSEIAAVNRGFNAMTANLRADRAGPRAAAGRRLARPAHAARAAAPRRRDDGARRRDAHGHGRRHRGDGPHHRPVPRLRAKRRRRDARNRRPRRGRRRVRRSATRAPARPSRSQRAACRGCRSRRPRSRASSRISSTTRSPTARRRSR